MANTRGAVVCFALLWGLSTPHRAFGGPPPPAHFDLTTLRPGQKGECHTVFEGDQVEPFGFEVKGLMPNFLGPQKDIVLVKLLGDKPTFTGVVAGMSGSPCSIDGKLVGALSYAFAMFAKEPIAGITPIANMIEVLNLPREPKPWVAQASAADAEWQAFKNGTASPAAVANDASMVPIATPLSLGGMPPKVRQHFAPWLRSVGFEPMAAGSTGAHTALVGHDGLVPGGAVAAVLARGDVDIAATGTVTYVHDNQVLAFGHPFFGAGAVSLPMAQARILNTMVSAMRSFKMATTGATVGELTQDRLTAIGGTLGPSPRMIEVKGHVTTPGGTKPFRFEVARDLTMTPRVVGMGLTSVLTGRVDNAEHGVMRFEGTITAKGVPPLTVRNVYAAPREGGLLGTAAVDFAQVVSLLWNAPYGFPQEVAIEVKASIEPDFAHDTVETLSVDRARVRPGDRVLFTATLRQHDGARVRETFAVMVPKRWAGHAVRVQAGGLDATEQLYRETTGAAVPLNYADLTAWVQKRRSDGNLFLMGTRDGAGLKTGVVDMPFLPPSLVATLATEHTAHPQERGVAFETRRARPGTVSGAATTTINVLSY